MILNKIDLKRPLNQKTDKKIFYVSAKTGEGLDDVLYTIYEEIVKKSKSYDNSKAMVANVRQANELREAENNIAKALKESSEEIIAEYLRQANECLERIIGNIDIEEVLGKIFSNFCIGK